MRASASPAASKKRGFCSPLAACQRRGTLRCAVLLRASPGCPSMDTPTHDSPLTSPGHPLGGAKHASLKDTAEPLYPGGQPYELGLVLTTHYSRLTTHFESEVTRAITGHSTSRSGGHSRVIRQSSAAP